jgi:hypothetical protein
MAELAQDIEVASSTSAMAAPSPQPQRQQQVADAPDGADAPAEQAPRAPLASRAAQAKERRASLVIKETGVLMEVRGSFIRGSQHLPCTAARSIAGQTTRLRS